MKIDDITQEVEENKILKKIVEVSEDFLQSSDIVLNYQKITDTILDFSGAKYAAFNLFDEDGDKYTTVALSATGTIIKKLSSLFGFNLLGKVWDNDPVRAAKINSYPIIHILSVREYIEDLVPKPVALLVEKTLNVGKVAHINIFKDNIMIGSFTLVMPKNSSLKNKDYIELYTRQLGLLITRTRSEVKLIEREMELRSIFSSTSDPLFVFDQKTCQILDVNDRACSLYGYSREEMLKLSASDMSAEPEITRNSMKNLESFVPIRHHKKKDGTIFTVELSASCFELKGRNIRTVSIRDTTERLKAEDALQQSNNKYRQLFDNMTTGFALHEMIYDNKGNPIDYRFLEINSAFEKLTGLKASLLIGKTVKDIIPETEQYWIDTYSTVAKTGKSISFQNYAAGLKKWFESWVFSPAKNQFATIFSDITERKKAEEEIKSLAKFPDENPNLVARVDYLGEILYRNHAYKRIFKDNDPIPNKLQDAIKKITAENIFNKVDVEIEVGNRIFLFYFTPIKKDAYINLYGEDITERRHAEDTVIEQMKELRENRALLDNVSEISHVGGWIFNPKTLTQTWTDETFKILEIDTSKGEPKVPEGLDFIIPAYRPMAQKAIENTIKFGEPYDQEWEVITAKGNRRWVNAVAKAEKEGDEIKSVLGSFQDITERKNRENEITYISYHDKLTEIYNRRFVEEEINRLNVKRQLPLSIIMADLNSLKLTNDTFGHSTGDTILKETAALLKKICRADDILARWGGDEFVIILPKTSNTEGEGIVERIKEGCAYLTSQIIPLSLAIGIATKAEESQDINKIINDAEGNMYKNKLVEKESNSSSILSALEQTLFEKSNETLEHTHRIKENALKLGKSIKLGSHQLDELSLLASLHDIGKVAIPETILTKDGKPTKEEWTVIRRHPEIGFNIAQSSSQISHVAKFILSCHENWDGSGYPQELKGEAIPIVSRIIFICDSYDVMTSKRSYKKAMSKSGAIKELKRCVGTQFDPVLVEKFIEILSENSAEKE